MKWAFVLAMAASLAVGSGRSWSSPAMAFSPPTPAPSARIAPARPPSAVMSVASPAAPVGSPAAPFGSPAAPFGSPVVVGAMSSARWVWPSDAPQTVVHPFAPPSTRWGSGHRGVDLAAVVGGSIRAPADGQVAFSGMVAGRPVVVIAHPGGLRSTFEPVSATVSVGALVRQSEVIGLLSAQPGHCAPASCLHWGVLRGEVYLDPLSLISGRVVLLPVR